MEAANQEGGATEAETSFIGQYVILRMKRVEFNMFCSELRDWLGVGDTRSWDYAVCSVCSTLSMLYTVYAVVGVCCSWCMLYSVLTLDNGIERLRAMP
jgi:hypothetical protein